LEKKRGEELLCVERKALGGEGRVAGWGGGGGGAGRGAWRSSSTCTTRTHGFARTVREGGTECPSVPDRNISPFSKFQTWSSKPPKIPQKFVLIEEIMGNPFCLNRQGMIDLKRKFFPEGYFWTFEWDVWLQDEVLKSGKNHLNSYLREKYFTMIWDDMCLIEEKKVSSQDMCLYYVQNYF
jgi:hypothetical protein